MLGVEKSQAGCNENIIDTLSPIIRDIIYSRKEQNFEIKINEHDVM